MSLILAFLTVKIGRKRHVWHLDDREKRPILGLVKLAAQDFCLMLSISTCLEETDAFILAYVSATSLLQCSNSFKELAIHQELRDCGTSC